MTDFSKEVSQRIYENGRSEELQGAATQFLQTSLQSKYSYNFSWLGRPIIQYPQDIVAMQEIIWNVQPELIIETGIAHGGSLILSASILELIAACTGIQGSVVGIDIDVRPHNREAIERHPLCRRISMIEGSSVDPHVVGRVHEMAKGKKSVLVCLDSNHTHQHVLDELNAYAGLTTVGSYCVVFDTIVEDLSAASNVDRPWGKGNNPKTAVHEWLAGHPDFEIDKAMEHKLLVTVAPDGYLRRTR
jgi:cephalosporin hydroxylase